MLYKNKIINYIIVLAIFLNSIFLTCFAQGSLILKEKVKKLIVGRHNKKFVKMRFGYPSFIVKTNVEIFCYYYLHYPKKTKNGIKRRCLFIYFKNKKYLGYKIY